MWETNWRLAKDEWGQMEEIKLHVLIILIMNCIFSKLLQTQLRLLKMYSSLAFLFF